MNDNDALTTRFGAGASDIQLSGDAPAVHHQLAGRGSVRRFRDEPVPDQLLRRLCALALSAPTKSDLQQRDIIIIKSSDLRSQITARLTSGRLGQKWLADLPSLLIFCGNNRRQRRVHALRGKDFANDHLDAFFNASVDAAIALSAFVIAAEAEGLGTCPISAVRNEPEALARLLHLPDYVFPVSGLAVGYPIEPAQLSPRLPLSATVHYDAYSEGHLDSEIEEYDRRRSRIQPYASQRYVADFGTAANYGWSEDKARQYAFPERQGFGHYVKRIGFKLD